MQQQTALSPAIDEDAPTLVRHQRSRPTAGNKSSALVLTVKTGHHKGEIFRLNPGTNLIGRSLKAEIRLGDDGVSRRHATISIDENNGAIVKDLDSTNGTFVNGKKISATTVKAGDKLRVGSHAILELMLESVSSIKAKRATRQVEQDAPMQRRKSGDAPEIPFLSKFYAMDPQFVVAKPCWGDSGEALDAYERLLRIRKKKLGSRHVAVAEILEVMATALQDNARFEQALDCYQKAHSIYMHSSNLLKPRAARALVRRAQCELSLVRNGAALASFERAEVLLTEECASEYEIACIRLSIARVLWMTKQELARGLRLAQDAELTFKVGGATTAVLQLQANKYARLIESALGREGAGKRNRAQDENPRLLILER